MDRKGKTKNEKGKIKENRKVGTGKKKHQEKLKGK